jgi:hypothetical protein
MPPISLVALSGRYLSFAEREEIAILHAERVGVREIARRLSRSASTVSRELRRNASTRGHAVVYRATTAQWQAERRAGRPKVCKLAANDALREYVQERLAGAIARPDGEPAPGPDVGWVGRRHGRRRDRRWAKAWSPEQIAHRLPLDFPGGTSLNQRRYPPRLAPTEDLDGNPEVFYNVHQREIPKYGSPRHVDVWADDQVTLWLQYSTQWDSLAHAGAEFDADGDGVEEAVFYNGYRAGVDLVGPKPDARGDGWKHISFAHHLGLEHMAFHGVQGRGVLVDLAHHLGHEWRGVDRATLEEIMAADNVVVAVGADPFIPPVPGLRELDGVWTNREVTGMKAVPRRLLILGGGPVGAEMAQAVRRLGGEVTLVEGASHVLAREPAPLGDALGEELRRDGIELLTGVHAASARQDGPDYVLVLEDGRERRGDRLLAATGRRPRVTGIGLETVGITPAPQGVPVDARMRAGERLWAIGDVTGIRLLTHVGKYQGEVAAANILGEPREANYEAVPDVVYTDPQAAAVGEPLSLPVQETISLLLLTNWPEYNSTETLELLELPVTSGGTESRSS